MYPIHTLFGVSYYSWAIKPVLFTLSICADPEVGGGGGGGGLKNHKNIGSLSNTGPDPLKDHKSTKPEFSVGPSSARQRNSI